MKHLTLIIAVLAVASAFAGKPSRADRWEEEALRRKADYVYLEGVNSSLKGDNASYFELLRYAHSLNPDDKNTANEYAVNMLQLQRSDTAAVAQALGMMKAYFDENPDDFYSGIRYAMLSQALGDTHEALRVYGILHSKFPAKPVVTERYAQAWAQSGVAGGIDSALTLYDSLEITEGLSTQIVVAKINLMMVRRDTAGIVMQARRLLQSAPQSVEYNVFMGDVLGAVGRSDSALVYYNRACSLDSTSAPAFFSRANYYHQIGDSAAFDREIFNVLKMESLDIDTKVGVMRNYVGELYNDSLQQSRITDLFETMVEMHPLEPQIRSFYATYLYLQGEIAEGVEQQTAALDLDPADEQGWVILVSSYAQLEQTDKAIEAADRAIHYFPDADRLWSLRGSLHQIQGDYDLADADTDRAIEIAEGDVARDAERLSRYYLLKGDIKQAQDCPDEALELYNKALQTNPYNIVAANNCAYMLSCQGRDLDRAMALVAMVMEQEPNNTSYVDTYAWVLYKAGAYAEAKEQIDRVLELDPESGAEVLDHAGDIYQKNGLTAEAVEFWTRALAIEPDNHEIKDKLNHK